jgi:hypothetical protein
MSMPRFLRTEDGVLINVDQIKQIEADGEWRCKATLNDGGGVWFADGIDFVEARLAPVVAATPGHTVQDYGEDDYGNPVVTLLPVVAWRLADGLALPVTPADAETFDPRVRGGPDDHLYKRTLPDQSGWWKAIAKSARDRRDYEAKQRARPPFSIVPDEKP